MSERADRAARLAVAAWILLVACIAAWPFAGLGIGPVTATLAVFPLLLPVPGIVRGSTRTLRAAPLALAPALALAITETLVNPAARVLMGASLALVLLAFAAVVAKLRATPKA